MRTVKLLTAITCSVLLAPVASALPTIYFGEDLGQGEGTVLGSTPNADAAQASFLAALLNPGVETFESSASGSPGAISFLGAGVTATFAGSGDVTIVSDGSTNGYGRYGVTNDADNDERYLETSSNFSIAFSSPVAAFGFYGIDIGDFDGQVTATTAGGLVEAFNIGNSTNTLGGSVLFWGVIDSVNTFTSISFGNTSFGNDTFAFDDFTVGSLAQVIPETPVPEPGTLFLFGFGLAGLRLARKFGVKQ